MKLNCSVLIVNRSVNVSPAMAQSKYLRSSLVLCRCPEPNKYTLLHCTLQNKNGTRYRLNENVLRIFMKYCQDGKCTIQFKEPCLNLLIEAEPFQLKCFIFKLRKAVDNTLGPADAILPLVRNVSNASMKVEDPLQRKLMITDNSNYPLKGFPKSLERLYINKIEQSKFDKGILQLIKLQVLDLSNNVIQFLPEQLNSLPNLKELVLSHNSLGKGNLNDWEWIGGFLSKSLRLLDLSYNKLNFVPEVIGRLVNLATLRLDNNNLKTLPWGIGNLKGLKIFVLSDNQLSVFPSTLRSLRLQRLDVANNKFGGNKALKPQIFRTPMHVLTLKELAAQKVLRERFVYTKETIPLTLKFFLDYVKYCYCGKACYSMFIKTRQSFLLPNVADTVNSSVSDSVFVPMEYFFCSERCYRSASYRNPIIR